MNIFRPFHLPRHHRTVRQRPVNFASRHFFNATQQRFKMSGKSDDQVIEEFNELVNMSASNLEKWLKTEDSESAGWGEGESVGHQSGRTIVDILKRNPKKDPSKYTEDDLQHMRKVASYCKRHLAQESKLKDSKSTEELQESKAYRSLKNWGHDMLA